MAAPFLNVRRSTQGIEQRLLSGNLEPIQGKTHLALCALEDAYHGYHLLRRRVVRHALDIPQDLTLTALHRPTLRSDG